MNNKFNLNNIKNNNLNGGIGGSNSFYFNQHPDFTWYNDNNLNNIIFNKNKNKNKNKKFESQFEVYSKLLDNLLKYDEKKALINLDFINNFFRYIYYDINGDILNITKKINNEYVINSEDYKLTN
jgi:hypothetical protein